jgi:anti-sigma factor RsiW
MMEYNDQLKLQAYLDGELPEGEAARWAERLARDQEAAALLTELRQTRECLGGFEEGVKLPETREFYWSKIQREIQRLDTPRPAATATLTVWARLRRLLVPAAGLALVAVAALVAAYRSGPTMVATETAVADSGAMIYHDYAVGATFVWLSYPADDDVADIDEEATLD